MTTIQFESDQVLPIGTEVYIPVPVVKDTAAATVVGYYAVIGHDEKKQPLAIPTSYKLSLANTRRTFGPLDEWKEEEFCKTKEEAACLAVVYTLDFTPEDWFRVLAVDTEGHRHEDSLSESELGRCCGIISSIRDSLIQMMLRGQATGIDRRILVNLLDLHSPAKATAPTLNKILAAMNISWLEDGTVVVDGKTLNTEEL